MEYVITTTEMNDLENTNLNDLENELYYLVHVENTKRNA